MAVSVSRLTQESKSITFWTVCVFESQVVVVFFFFFSCCCYLFLVISFCFYVFFFRFMFISFYNLEHSTVSRLDL